MKARRATGRRRRVVVVVVPMRPNPPEAYAPTLRLGPRDEALWDAATGAIAHLDRLARFARGREATGDVLPRALETAAHVVAAVIRPYAAYRKARPLPQASGQRDLVANLHGAWRLARELQEQGRTLAAAPPAPDAWARRLDRASQREQAAALAKATAKIDEARASFELAREAIVENLGGGAAGHIKWGVVKVERVLAALGADRDAVGRMALAQQLIAQGMS